jgi:hypothetical protein
MWPSLDLRPAAHSTHGSWLGMYGNMHVIGLYFRQKPGCSCRCFLMSPVQHIETLLLYAKKQWQFTIFHGPLLILPTGCQSFWPFSSGLLGLWSKIRPEICRVNIGEDDIDQTMQCREYLYCYCTYYLGRNILGLLGIETFQQLLFKGVFSMFAINRYIYIDTDRLWFAECLRVAA